MYLQSTSEYAMQATSTSRLLSKLSGAIFCSSRNASTASTVAIRACRESCILDHH